MTENTFSIDFVARKAKNDNKQAFIYARITVDGEETEICIKEKIPHEKWNSKAEQVEGKAVEVTAINKHIDNYRCLIKNHHRSLVDKDRPFTVMDLRESILGKGRKKNKEHTLVKLFEKHEEAWKNQMEPGTLKNYPSTFQYVKNFIRYYTGKDDFHVAEVDFEFITDFAAYIPGNPLKEHDPCTTNGTAKHIERFKKVIGWAVKLKWVKDNPVKNFSPTRKRQKPRSLKSHQFSLLERFPLANPSLVLTRDLFIFSCYTGLAYADVMALSMDDFEITQNGTFFCGIYRKKSDEFSAVPLLRIAVAMVKKYKDDPRALSRGKVFPYVSNQQVNRNLKVLQNLFGFSFELTFHVARHTFATLIALRNGVGMRVVQQMMGHAKLATTEQYTRVDEEHMIEEMAPVNERLEERKKLDNPQLLSIVKNHQAYK